MPSHAIHEFLATRYLGLPEEVARSIDKFVDLSYLHDVGRKKAREPPVYSDLLYGKRVVNLNKSKSLKAELNAILSDRSKSLAFYFHHALDILAYRVASADILGLYSDTICRVLARGVIGDLQLGVDAKLREMGVHVVYGVYCYRQELENAITLSCMDPALISWVRENIVPKYERYRSLEYIKKAFSEVVPKIISSDARYEVGYRLGLLAHMNRSSARSRKIRVVDRVGDTVVGIPSDGIRISTKEVEKEIELRIDTKGKELSFSPYGLRRLRKEIIKLSALYSGLYHVLLAEPVPLEVSFSIWLATGKKKYSLAMNILKCYKKRDISDARECAEREFRYMTSSLNIVQQSEIINIKTKFLQAIEELKNYARSLKIDILNDI